MDKKTIKSLIYKAASLLLLSIFLCTSVFIYLQKSFGWFSDNTEVSTSGLSVQSSEGLDVRAEFAEPDSSAEGGYSVPNIQDAENLNAFNDLLPGQTRTVYLKVSNYTTSNVKVSLSLAAPNANDEKPIIHNASGNVVSALPNPHTGYKVHYFGSQLRINSVTCVGGSMAENARPAVSSALSGQARYLLETNLITGTDMQATYTSDLITLSSLSNKKLTTDFVLPAAASTAETDATYAILAIEVEFVDNRDVQNAYIDFGIPITIGDTTFTPICHRTIICTTEEVPN